MQQNSVNNHQSHPKFRCSTRLMLWTSYLSLSYTDVEDDKTIKDDCTWQKSVKEREPVPSSILLIMSWTCWPGSASLITPRIGSHFRWSKGIFRKKGIMWASRCATFHGTMTPLKRTLTSISVGFSPALLITACKLPWATRPLFDLCFSLSSFLCS